MGTAIFSHQQTVSFLTVFVVVSWIVASTVRIWVPITYANVLDAAMPLVIGYWFSQRDRGADDEK